MIDMQKDMNLPSKSDRDVFLAGMLRTADFSSGFYQFPTIHDDIVDRPEALTLWSKRKQCREKTNCGLVFYEYDSQFDGSNGIYNTFKYGSASKQQAILKELSEFSFVVCPDYSVYANFPIYMQIGAIGKSREIGYILQSHRIKTIVDFRATYPWSYEAALSGLSKGQTVAVGSLGALRDRKSRNLLCASMIALANCVAPKRVIVYGPAPVDVFGCLIDRGAEIWQYDSDISKAFKTIKERNTD